MNRLLVSFFILVLVASLHAEKIVLVAGGEIDYEASPRLRRRIFEEICDQIRRDMAASKLCPGDKLPAERELAQQFGVSRNAVREALRSLEVAGIVRLQKGVKGGAIDMMVVH